LIYVKDLQNQSTYLNKQPDSKDVQQKTNITSYITVGRSAEKPSNKKIIQLILLNP